VKNKFESPAHQGDLKQNVLREIRVADAMRGIDRTRAISIRTTFPELRELIKSSHEITYPIVDPNGDRMLGVLNVQDIRPHMFDSALDQLLLAADLMRPPVHIDESKSLYDALLMSLESELDDIPVTRGPEATLVGILRRGDILRAYNERVLIESDEEE
jgi:CIC family chloride channel protein